MKEYRYNKELKKVVIFHSPAIAILDRVAFMIGSGVMLFFILWHIFIVLKWPWLEQFNNIVYGIYFLTVLFIFVSYGIVRKNSHYIETHWYES